MLILKTLGNEEGREKKILTIHIITTSTDKHFGLVSEPDLYLSILINFTKLIEKVSKKV